MVLSALRQRNSGTKHLHHTLSDGAAFSREGRGNAAIRYWLRSARQCAKHLLLCREFHDEEQERLVRRLAGRTCFVSRTRNGFDIPCSRAEEFSQLRIHRAIHLDELRPGAFETFAGESLRSINAELAAKGDSAGGVVERVGRASGKYAIALRIRLGAEAEGNPLVLGTFTSSSTTPRHLLNIILKTVRINSHTTRYRASTGRRPPSRLLRPGRP